MPEPVRVVVNPASGAGRARARALRLRPRLEAVFGPLEWRQSASAAHLEALVGEAACRGDERVLVAGGDGAVQGALQALVGSETALGVLPVGTGNDFAASLGVPPDARAVDVLARGHVRAVDVGEAAGHAFGCVLGVGMDSEALERIGAARLLRRGKLLYALAALRTLVTWDPPRAWIRWGESSDECWEGRLVFAAVSNTATYAGGMRIAPGARTDDGALDVCIVEAAPWSRLVARFGRVRSGRHRGLAGVFHGRAARIELASERPLPVTLDGDLTDLTTPTVAEVRPAAVRVLGAPLALAPGLDLADVRAAS